MAAKLARLVYRMLRYGMKYVDQEAQFYDAQHRKLQVTQLKWKAAKLPSWDFGLSKLPQPKTPGVSGDKMEAKRGTMYRAPTSGKADPSAPVGDDNRRREKRVRTEVRPHR